jgi:flagellin FlaB
MVLVAAVAAAVLISTANQVREQATSTGDQAINNVAAGFVHQSVIGTVAATESTISKIEIDIRLVAGSPAVDLTHAVVVWTVGAVSDTLTYAEVGDAAKGVFEVGKVLQVSEYDDPNMGQGDLFRVTITHSDTGADDAASEISVAALTHVNIQIIPSQGSPCIIDFMTPEILQPGSLNLA